MFGEYLVVVALFASFAPAAIAMWFISHSRYLWGIPIVVLWLILHSYIILLLDRRKIVRLPISVIGSLLIVVALGFIFNVY
jgi:hypothetical protein